MLPILVALISAATAADLSQQLRLVDAQGTPINGTTDIRVDLVADDTPGAPETTCHTQSFGNQPFQDGYTSVVLTNVSDTCGQGDWWVAVSIGSPLEEVGPRRKLTAVPTALSANHVSGFVDLVVDEFSPGPACAVEGRMAWDSSADVLRVCDGSTWLTVGANLFGTQNNPALSCKTLKTQSPNAPSGVYWLDPDGDAQNAFQAYCDMVTDDGGWTLAYAIADNSTMKTTGAQNTTGLLVDDISQPISGKLSDAVIRQLYTEQYRTEQYGTTPYRTYCTFDNINNYGDGARNSKRCATMYSSGASYTGVASSGQWSEGFSDYTGTNGVIFQLNHGDSRIGCHTRNSAAGTTDTGCTSGGGCHCRAWVR